MENLDHFVCTEYPDDIAAHLLALARPDAEDAEKLPEFKELENAVFELSVYAENPRNRETFKILYYTLEKIIQNHRKHIIGTHEDFEN